jgi:hypothetical protein
MRPYARYPYLRVWVGCSLNIPAFHGVEGSKIFNVLIDLQLWYDCKHGV